MTRRSLLRVSPSLIVSVGLAVLAVLAVPTLASAGERVVFCEQRDGACAQANRTLGNSGRGCWALVDDATLIAGAEKAGPPKRRLLYFTRGAYEEAIAGLSAKERERAVLRRLEVMSAGVPIHLLGLIREDLLQVAAAVRELVGDDLGTALDAAVVISGGPNRFGGARPGDALSETQKSLARVIAELPEGLATVDYGKEAALLAEIDTELSQAGTPRPLPFAAPERVYFVPRMSASGRSDPLFLDQPDYGWRGGVVRMLRPHDLVASPWRERKPRLLYFGRASFLRDIGTLTDAQIDRRLRARLAGVPARDAEEFAASVAFDHAVLVRQYSAPLRERQVPWLPRWETLVARDRDGLRRALAAAQPRAPDERKARIEKLRADVALATVLLRVGSGTDTTTNEPRITQIATLIGRLSN